MWAPRQVLSSLNSPMETIEGRIWKDLTGVFQLRARHRARGIKKLKLHVNVLSL